MLSRAYRVLAVLMFLCPMGFVLAALLAYGSSVVFFVEMAGFWTFGTYWALKTWELSLSKLERAPGAAPRDMAGVRHEARKGRCGWLPIVPNAQFRALGTNDGGAATAAKVEGCLAIWY